MARWVSYTKKQKGDRACKGQAVILLNLQKNSYRRTTHVKIVESDHLLSMEGFIVSIHILTQGKEPSQVTLSYYDYLEGSELELRVNMLFNASCLLSAASNLQTVAFQFNEKRICLSRAELESWYGRALTNELTEYMILKRMEKLVIEGNDLPL